ncbi:MAG: TRAP transporter small permease [Desulfobacteraceae bacterium]
MINALYRLERIIRRMEQGFVVAFLSAMIVVAFSQIVLRNFWSTGFSWADALVRYSVLWVGFIGASMAAREGKHIKIDALSQWLPAKHRELLQVLISVCTALVCLFLTLAAFNFVRFEAQMGSRTFFNLPIWIPQLIMPLSFALMTLRYTSRSARALAGAMKTADTPSPPEET